MSINFPNNPAINDEYVFEGKTLVVPFYLKEGPACDTRVVGLSQALRDVTQQEGFPYAVDWPLKSRDNL